MPLSCHLFCNFFISPFLSCTKVTSKGPKAKRLLSECGGTVPSSTPRSEVPRTRYSRCLCVVLPYPMEHRVQTLEGRSLVFTSIIAGIRAGGAIRVFGIPPSCVCSYVMLNSTSLYFRQDIRSDPLYVFFVYFWPCWKNPLKFPRYHYQDSVFFLRPIPGTNFLEGYPTLLEWPLC